MQNLFKRLLGSRPDLPQMPALTPAQHQMNTLLDTAATALEQGFHQTALDTYQHGLTLARTAGQPANVEHFLSGIGAVYVAQNNFEAARPVFEEALEIARHLNDRRVLARCLNNYGSFYAKQGEWGTAQTYHQQALDSARASGNAEVIALALENLAQDYLKQDNPGYAQHLLKEAVIITQAAGQPQLASRVIGLLAEATLAADDRVAAQKLLGQALYLARQASQPDLELRWLQGLARLEMENRNYAQAIKYLQEVENLALRLGNQSAEFFMNTALDLTTAYQRSGNSTLAEEYATRALAQARSTGNVAHEAMALNRLGMAAYTMGDLNRALSYLTEALAFYHDETRTQLDEHIQILLTLGQIAVRQNRLGEAASFVDQALQLARRGENPAREAEVLYLSGTLAARQGDRDTAVGRWQDALRLMDSADSAQIARLRCDIAQSRRETGDFKSALDEYEKALLLLNHISHPPTRGLVLSNAATLYTEMGDVDTAQAFYEESIEIARTTGDTRAESLRLGNLGWFYALTGRPQSAIHHLESALKLSRQLEDTMMIAVQTNNLACTYAQLKDYETARTLHKQAIVAATAVDSDRWLGVFQADLGVTLVALNRPDEAEPLFLSAVERSERTGDLENLTRAQARLAGLYVRTGRLDAAADPATQAEQRARKMYYQRGIADSVAALGDLARARGDDKAAQRYYTEALRLYTILHDPGARRVAEFVPQGA